MVPGHGSVNSPDKGSFLPVVFQTQNPPDIRWQLPPWGKAQTLLENSHPGSEGDPFYKSLFGQILMLWTIVT